MHDSDREFDSAKDELRLRYLCSFGNEATSLMAQGLPNKLMEPTREIEWSKSEKALRVSLLPTRWLIMALGMKYEKKRD